MAEHSSRIHSDDGPLVGAARSAEAAVRQVREVGQQRIEQTIDGSRELIRENPMKAILLAVGVGAVVGYMIGRRR